MNLIFVSGSLLNLFFLSWESSIGKASWESSIRKASWESSIGESSWEPSIRISSYSCKGTDSIGNTSSSYRGSSQRSRGWDFMDRSGFLLGSKASSSSVVKSSLESSLGSSNLFSISKVFSSNLSSLYISIHRSQSSMSSCFSSSKSSIELSLSSSNISSVLNRKGSGSSQERSNQQFVHLGLLQRIFRVNSPC